MSVEIRATVADDLAAEIEIWSRHHFGVGKRAEYVKRALRSQAKRDRAMWEKNHAIGSSPA